MRRYTDKFTVDILICNECHKSMFVPRKSGHKRAMGHIKDMYCPWCNVADFMSCHGAALMSCR